MRIKTRKLYKHTGGRKVARKRFTTQTKSVRSFLFDGWLVKQVMKGFGWHYKGDEIEEESQDVAETQLHETYATTVVRTETKTKKYLEFHRVSPYSKNPLFNLTELLSNIIFFIRNIVRYLVVPLTVLCLLVGIFGASAGIRDAETGYYIAAGVVGVYVAGLILPSLILAGFGRLWRKVFDIDEKLRETLRVNGYSDALDE